MTRDASASEIEKLAAHIVDALPAVPIVRMCYCGAPLSEHEFWEDRIYDVNGRKCPSRLGSDFSESVASTKATYRDQQIRVVSALLTTREAHPQQEMGLLQPNPCPVTAFPTGSTCVVCGRHESEHRKPDEGLPQLPQENKWLSVEDWRDIEIAVLRSPTFSAHARAEQEQLIDRIRDQRQGAGDNHHNALTYPYCNPKGWKFAEPTDSK